VAPPFAPASVSLRLYPHNDLAPAAIVDELRAQAALGAEHGFDGVMTSEHHGGFPGYLPNPLQAVGFCLDAMATGWGAPAPLLLPLRPPAMVAEEISWLDARFPGRVGLGVASGALEDDFRIMDVPMRGLTERFASGLEAVAAILRGDATAPLSGDPAIAARRDAPIPLLSAAMGLTAVRRAAGVGAGLLFDSLSAPERCRRLTDAYRDVNGPGTCVLIRRAWVGDPPREKMGDQLDVYKGYSSPVAQAHWGDDELVTAVDPAEVADGLVDAMRRAGADALNVRIHVPGLAPELVREQIVALGDGVLDRVRASLSG
jgi:alkanesulfonate monooxygenase SsuD/methylene tetrahydromethanopterin reductase-like flavin-dependent oxidoreductase (luciferase family)